MRHAFTLPENPQIPRQSEWISLRHQGNPEPIEGIPRRIEGSIHNIKGNTLHIPFNIPNTEGNIKA